MFTKETAESFCSQILECGILDVRFAIDLYNINDIDLDYDELKSNFGEVNINTVIYDGIYKTAEKFIDENETVIKKILNIGDLDEYRSYNDLYEIFTNFIDSHLRFKDERIQNLFEQSRYEV
ncbi:MAG: hypothetical protein WC850_06020 [Candidatus Gracilibacteria bacterium]